MHMFLGFRQLQRLEYSSPAYLQAWECLTKIVITGMGIPLAFPLRGER